MPEGKKSIFLNVAIVVAVVLTIVIIGENIKTALTPQYRYREVDAKAVLKAIEDAGLVPTEAKFYKALDTK
ncbi:MAG: hypothetical protein ABH847_01535 [Candidatus Omnitrophota bacterium]